MDRDMELVWDESKRQKVLTERLLDFMDAIEVLSDPEVSIYADDRNYDEPRFNAYGISKGRNLRVCFTPRNGKVRIITMFKVSEKEWSKYYEKND
jgi:uncharacterized DUF497 family protein